MSAPPTYRGPAASPPLSKFSRWRPAIISALVALAYVGTGRLGLMLPAFGTNVTLLWLPTGIAVAALLRWGLSVWPGITLGAIAVNVAIGVPWPVALVVAVGNTLAPLLTAWTLRRLDLHAAFDRKRDILLLTGAAAIGMLVSASVGVGASAVAGLLPDGRLTAWLIWWAGDATGVVVAAPLLLASSNEEIRTLLTRRRELSSWFVATAIVTWVVFVLNGGPDRTAWSVAFVPLLTVTWAALRFGPIGTSIALIVVSAGAAYGTATGHGPFFRSTPLESASLMWIFMSTAATLGWITLALHAAQERVSAMQVLLDRALSDVSLGILIAGIDRRITYANDGFTRLTGYGESELLGRSCALLQGPATDPATAARVKAAVHSSGSFDGDILNYRKDGTTFWNSLIISPVRDEHGIRTGFLGIQRDISSRKQAEAVLQQSEAHLQLVIELEGKCVVRLSMEGTPLEINRAGLALTEADSLDTLRSRPFESLVDSAHRTVFSDLFSRAGRGESGHGEVAITGLRGTGRWLDVHAVPHRNAQRDIVGVFAVMHDITRRKQATEELTRGLSDLQLLLDAMPAYISLVDAEERYRMVNRRYEVFFGRPAEQIVGQRLRDVQSKEAYAEMQPHLQAALSGKAVRYQSNPEDSQGVRHWLDVQYVPRRDADGAHAGFFVLVFDITDSKQAQVSLAESEDRYRSLARFAPVGVFRTDREGACVYVNDCWCAMAGMTADEAMGAGWMNAIHPEDRSRVVAEWQAACRDEVEFRSEYRFLSAAGAAVWLQGASVALRAPDGAVSGYLGSVTDLTARRAAEEARLRFDAHLQHAQKLESLGVLAGGIAHDFNNLLTSVLGNASIAAVLLSPESPAQECIAHITEASLRAADLCKQMLAYSGRGRFVVQTLDLGHLVEQTTRMLQISISKNAVLRFQLASGLPAVNVDATQLRQVIMNLVINASEAIGDTNGVISLSTVLARVDAETLLNTDAEADVAPGDYVCLEVADTGCGMSLVTRAKIFDPFFTTKFTGRGLGLAAVLGIIRGHGGTLTVTSEVGHGTTFRLYFPVADGERMPAPTAPHALPAWRHSGTVLVVDDEESMRVTVARMLRLHGLVAVTAADGLEAVKIFRDTPDRFALVMLDLTMPNLDGERTLVELRRIRSDVRVVLMSGFDAHESMMRFAGRGLAGFLQKPFTVETLAAVLQPAINPDAVSP